MRIPGRLAAMAAAAAVAAGVLAAGCSGGGSVTGLEQKGLVKGTVTVGGVSVAGAALFVDGAYSGAVSAPDGSLTLQITPGPHVLWLVVNGQRTSQAMVMIGEGEMIAEFTVTRNQDGSLTLIAVVTPVEAPAPAPTVMPEAIGCATASLADLVAAVEALDEEQFAGGDAENRKRTLLKKLDVVVANAEKGNCKGAYQKLLADIAPKTDGCAAGGGPDAGDWIIDCAAQQDLDPLVDAALTDLAAGIVPEED